MPPADVGAGPTFTTSELAEAAGVGPQTLRYYERRGLLPDPPRTPGGHRVYGPMHLTRLRFVQRAQSVGFDLREVEELLALDEMDPRRGGEAATRFLDSVDAKLDALRRLRTALVALADRAPGRSVKPGPLEGALGDPA